MLRHRDTDEVLSDELITLSLLREVERQHPLAVDRLRLQKLCFLLTNEWFGQRRKGLNYRFFRYRLGPFTTDLYQTEVDLAQAGLISNANGAWAIRLTDEGRSLAEAFTEEVLQAPENWHFWTDIERVAREFGGLSTRELLIAVYDLEVTPLGWREAWPLRDVPLGVDLTRVLEDEESVELLEVAPAWTETLSLLLNRTAEDVEVKLHAVPGRDS